MPKKTTKTAAKAKAPTTKKKFILERTPIVAVMGHVDHGKTSLLDAIRGTNVQAGEAGGITQNTRAHQITFHDHKITFIDTPGHEAFSNMRSRGAKVTDIVLLVVAIDDGVQPQTKESIEFAKAEKVPVIVAVNKVDLPGKNLQKIKQELTTAGLSLEEYGGDAMLVEVSAVKKTGIDELLERILLLAEINELKKENPPAGLLAKAFVLESTLDPQKGPVALCIVKAGTITKANLVVHDQGYAKVRSLLDQNQQAIETAETGDPVWIIGLDKLLAAGAEIVLVETEKQAKELVKAGGTKAIEPENQPEAEDKISEDDLALLSQLLSSEASKDEKKYLTVVLKTDSQGTLEAVSNELASLNDEAVEIKILSAGIGQITEQDVLTAKNAKGIVIGFQAPMSKHVQEVARKERVLVRSYDVIYDLLQELSEAMEGLIEPQFEEVEIARAKIKKLFTLSNGQLVAGSEVTKGNFVKGFKVYALRGNSRIGEGKITSLRQLKNEVKEVKKGEECGILIEPQLTLAEGDELVCFKLEKKF